MTIRNRQVRAVSCAMLVLGLWLVAASLPAQTVKQVASGLSTPIFVTAPVGDTNRLFIAQQGSGGSASIRILDLTTGILNPTPFLTLTGLQTGGEQGLLGMAFDPNYATNGRFYLDYTTPGGAFNAGVSNIERFNVSAGNPNVANPASGTKVLTVDQPQTNHNGGWIGFSNRPGDSNNLYIAKGDGGNANDTGPGHFEPGGNAQNTNVLLGKILRVDVNQAGPGYTLPVANPATGETANPFGNEVFVYGLRNPFRNSFDSATGNLMIGDVGQAAREEVDVQHASNPGGGENYGWRALEGTIPTPGVGDPIPLGTVAPVFEYDHTVGQTLIGGYVYHGSIASLDGKYIFGDYLGGTGGGGSRIFEINPDGTGFHDITSMLFAGTGFSLHNVYSFGVDARGELYIVDGTGGAVYEITQLVPEPSSLVLAIAAAAGAVLCGLRRTRVRRARLDRASA